MSSQFIKAEGVGLGQNSVSRVCVSVQFAPPPSSKMRSGLAGGRSLRQIHVRVSRMFDWKFSIKFRIRKGGEGNAHWGRKLFPLSFICNNIHREIHSKIVLRIGSNLKWKGYSHGDKTLLVGVIKLSKRKERRGKGEKKVSRASLWVQSRATVTHFLYLPHLSVSQVSLVWLVINHEISIYNLW